MSIDTDDVYLNLQDACKQALKHLLLHLSPSLSFPQPHWQLIANMGEVIVRYYDTCIILEIQKTKYSCCALR